MMLHSLVMFFLTPACLQWGYLLDNLLYNFPKNLLRDRKDSRKRCGQQRRWQGDMEMASGKSSTSNKHSQNADLLQDLPT